MADQADIELHYDTVGPLHRVRMRDVQGDFPDYTCAFFDGDFSKSLVRAQVDKHVWILDNLGLGENRLAGRRILEIGCGWAPFMYAVHHRGGLIVGLTLSAGQYDYCRKRGYDVRLCDYKKLQPGALCHMEGIVAIGSLEAFCSVEDMLAGRQEDIYRQFFRICAERLKPGRRLYVQTMLWGDSVPDYRALSLDAPPDSTEAILKRMESLYPGSWLPNSLKQLVDCASEDFDFVMSKNGRLDYMQTLQRWHEATPNLWRWQNLPQTFRHGVPLLYRMATNRHARTQVRSIFRGDQFECFRRGIMTHERIFFQKKS
jgi:cyclopropane-fatty-acyl-phospholipid synthase